MKEKEKFFHSYLFYGLDGTGKKRAVTALIREITQKKMTQEEIFSGKIEDIILLNPLEEEKNGKKVIKDISVEQTRQAIKSLNLFPSQLNCRFLIVNFAEKLNMASANSLLKIVEEPPQKAKVIFLSNNLEKILPTLRSRLQKIFLPLLSEEDLKNKLKEINSFITEEKQSELAQISYGRIVLAESYLEDEILMFEQKQSLEQFRSAIKGGLVESFALAESLAQDKKMAQKSIDNWVFYLQNFLLRKIEENQLENKVQKKMVDLISGLLLIKEKLDRPSANARLIWEEFFLSVI